MFSKPLLLAAFFSFLLSVFKGLVYFYTGSVLVLGSFLDSLVDSLTSYLNHKVQKLAKQAPDREHPFGHGGFEVISCLVQGIVILFLGLSLLIESIRRCVNPEYASIEVKNIVLGIFTLLFSALFGFFIQLILSRNLVELENAKGRSLAVFADRMHYVGDFVANLLSAIGLLLVWFFDAEIFDALFGIASSLFLIYTAFPLLFKSYKNILQSEAPIYLQQEIVNLVMESDSRVKGIHALRSREFGPYLFVDFHIKLHRNMSLLEAHLISDKIESEILAKISNADILVHIDPDSEEDEANWDPSYEIRK